MLKSNLLINMKRISKNLEIGYVLISVFSLLVIYHWLGTNITIRSLLFALPVLMASLFIATYKENISKIEDIWVKPLFYIKHQMLHNIYLLNLSLGIISLIVLLVNSERTILYFLILILMAVFLLIQIFNAKKANITLFFIQLIFIQLSLIYSLTLKYPFYYGFGDLTPHLKWIELLMQNHHIATQGSFSTYQYFPIYHIFFAMSGIVTGYLSPTGTFITAGLAWSVTCMIGYLIAFRITKDYRFSLITCLFFVLSKEVLLYGSYMITRSLAFIYFLFILYLLLGNDSNNSNSDNNTNNINNKLILLFFTLVLLLTHQTTTVFITFIVIVLFIFDYLFNDKNTRFGRYSLIYLVAYISYWFFVASGFVSRVILSLKTEIEGFDSPEFNIAMETASSNLSAETLFLLNRIDQMVVIFMLSLLFYVVLCNTSIFKKYFYIVIPSILFSFFYIPNPLLLFIQSTHVLLLYRLPLLISLFITIITIIGFVIGMKSISNKKIKLIFACVVLVVFLTFSIINEQNISDVSQISKVYGTSEDYYSNKEIAAFEFITLKAGNMSVFTDVNSNLFLKYYMLIDSELLTSDYFIPPNEFMNDNTTSNKYENNYILLNMYKVKTNFLKISDFSSGFGMKVMKYSYSDENENQNIDEVNTNLKYKYLVYNNNDIYIYR